MTRSARRNVSKLEVFAEISVAIAAILEDSHGLSVRVPKSLSAYRSHALRLAEAGRDIELLARSLSVLVRDDGKSPKRRGR